MSFYRQIIAKFSGLDDIDRAFKSNINRSVLNACYERSTMDCLSKKQMPMANGHSVSIDGLSSDELHKRAEQVVCEIRDMAR